MLSFDFNFLKGEFIEANANISKNFTEAEKRSKIQELESVVINPRKDMSLEEMIEDSITTHVGNHHLKQWIVKAPGIFAVQIGRFTFEGGQKKKLNDSVPIKLEIDLGAHLADNCVVSSQIAIKTQEFKKRS